MPQVKLLMSIKPGSLNPSCFCNIPQIGPGALPTVEQLYLLDQYTMSEEWELHNARANVLSTIGVVLPSSLALQPPQAVEEMGNNFTSQPPLNNPVPTTHSRSSPEGSPGDQRASKRQATHQGMFRMDQNYALNQESSVPAINATAYYDSIMLSQFPAPTHRGYLPPTRQPPATYPTFGGHASPLIDPGNNQATWRSSDQASYVPPVDANQEPEWAYGLVQPPAVATQEYHGQPTSSLLAGPNAASTSGHPSDPSSIAGLAHYSGPTLPMSEQASGSDVQLPFKYTLPQQSLSGVPTPTDSHSNNNTLFTHMPSLTHSHTQSNYDSAGVPTSSLPGSAPIMASNAWSQGSRSPHVFTKNSLNAELNGPRHSKSYEDWEKNLIFDFLIGPNAPPLRLAMAMQTVRYARPETTLAADWHTLANEVFHGKCVASALAVYWWKLVDVYGSLLALDTLPGDTDPSLSLVQRIVHKYNNVLRGTTGITKLDASDVASWCDDTNNGWFVRVHQRLQGLTTTEAFVGVHGQTSFPNISHTRSLSKMPRTKSTRSGSSGAHSALAYATTPPPPRSVGGSGAGSGRRPSQLSQSSLIIPGQYSTPQAPPNATANAEVLREHRILNNRTMGVLDAKEDWIRSGAVASRVNALAHLTTIDSEYRTKMLDHASKILALPNITAETKDKANLLLLEVLTPRSPQTFLDMLFQMEHTAVGASSSTLPPPPSPPPLP